jgi:prepilin-type N-terminal cleavage/methylation domain-containing protein
MKKNTGFTLIEILATITIIGILFTIGIVSYTNFNRKQMVSQSAKNIVNVLRQVQSNAISGVKDTSSCGVGAGADSLIGWNFTIVNMFYEIYGLCNSVPFGNKDYILPAGSQIRYSISPAGPIIFYPLVGGTNGRYTICVNWLNEPAYSYKISVENMGEINDVGFTTCP